MKKKAAIRRTPEEKQAIIAQIEKMQAEGKTVDDALKEIGLNKSQYYAWRKRSKKVKDLQEVLTFPLESGKLVIVAGNPTDILTVLERLNQLK